MCVSSSNKHAEHGKCIVATHHYAHAFITRAHHVVTHLFHIHARIPEGASSSIFVCSAACDAISSRPKPKHFIAPAVRAAMSSRLGGLDARFVSPKANSSKLLRAVILALFFRLQKPFRSGPPHPSTIPRRKMKPTMLTATKNGYSSTQ